MNTLRAFVAHRISEALNQLLSWEVILEMIEVPLPEKGDFAFPCFKIAKQIKLSPGLTAADLAPKLRPHFERVDVSGPYLNFTLHLSSAAKQVLYTKPDVGVTPSQKVMVEFSQPNTHKAFHVGHMRNLCLGDALVRILRGVGHHVISANYIGDMGVHVAKCLWGLSKDMVEMSPLMSRGEWLGEIYTSTHVQLEEWKEAAESGNPSAATALLKATREIAEVHQNLETAQGAVHTTWLRTRQWSIDEFLEIYNWSGVSFDRWYYESDFSEESQKLVDHYLQKGTFVESEGAVGIRNEELPHMPFFMLRKSDGAGLYATKDLALAQWKFQDPKLDRSIYVVDVRQTDHFRHVFLTLKKMGEPWADRCQHVPYEMVELPDGPMSARKGNIVTFRHLREKMTSHIRKMHLDFYQGDWSEEEIQATAHQIALGAIRYGMLSAGMTQRIVFDMEAWLQLKGNTGPYLQYTGSRLRSILHKCALENKVWDPSKISEATAALNDPCERQLVMRLDEFSFRVKDAANELRPSILCHYLYHLAQDTNKFVQTCPVKASEGELLQGRLLLVASVLQILTQGLSLLGIPLPNRM